jgi:hypothetical protein
MLGAIGVATIYFKWKTPPILEGHNFYVTLIELNDSKAYWNTQR